MATYTLGEINQLKKDLYDRAWQKSGGDQKKYEAMKKKIRNTVVFKLINPRKVV